MTQQGIIRGSYAISIRGGEKRHLGENKWLSERINRSIGERREFCDNDNVCLVVAPQVPGREFVAVEFFGADRGSAEEPIPASAESQMPLAQNNCYATVVYSGPLYFPHLKLPKVFQGAEAEVVAVEKRFRLEAGR